MKSIDAPMLRRMFMSGAAQLESKKDYINELNVFPVPDGDTGTNMTMTILSAAKEVDALENPDLDALCRAMASGSLRGARGNSGVILSQLLRGLTKGLQGKSEITSEVMAYSFEKAVESAYKAVMKPKEGTILTVARVMAESARSLSGEYPEDIGAFLEQVLDRGEAALRKTPELLPVLKEAGVVDSGGQGLIEAIRGALFALQGRDVVLQRRAGKPAAAKMAPKSKPSWQAQAQMKIRFAYCTEFMVLLNDPLTAKAEKDFKKYLSSLGDSLVFVGDEEMVKIHVHTNDPGLAIQSALAYGQLCNMKIDNMRMEHREKLFRMSGGKYVEIPGVEITGQAEKLPGEKQETPARAADFTEKKEKPEKKAPKEKKPVGFVAVLSGEGFSEIFKDLGVDHVVEGGQTMNPSTDDILQAVEEVNAETVFVLPNNKNIILAAEQAAKLAKKQDIRVIPTKTIPQGLSALMGFVPDLSLEENENQMKEEMGRIVSGEVTIAVRDTTIEGKTIHKGDYMGLGDSGLISVENALEEAAFSTARGLIGNAGGDAELLSVYYGEDAKKENAEALLARLQRDFPGIEAELFYGGQPVYPYILSVE